MQQIEQTISTVEIANAMGTSHKSILQKLEGSNRKGKHSEGIIEILSRLNFQPSDFFIKSSYTNERGKNYTCYKCTRKGCEFLAHKFNGEKGVIFTARYINRFHEMEQAITQALPEKNPPRDYMPKVPKVATKKGAKAPALPPAANWYERNASRIRRICKMYKVSKRTLYHYILLDLGKKFNLDSANRIYKWETDRAPQYAMDVVNYFPELGEAADKYLDSLEKLR